MCVCAGEEDSRDRREIGDEAVWTLSSAKPGNGVPQLRDDNFDTFWQYVQSLCVV